MNKKVAMGLLAVVLVAGLVSSCASTSDVPGDFPDISLADSKSPTQLLRNGTAERIPPTVVEAIASSGDESIGCLEKDVDPNGTVRSWRSSAHVALTDASADQLTEIVTTLVSSFEVEGWAASALGGTSRGGSKLLFSEDAAQSIQIVGLAPDEARPDVWDGATIPEASVLIVITGPCVRTDGAESDEVKRLEK